MLCFVKLDNSKEWLKKKKKEKKEREKRKRKRGKHDDDDNEDDDGDDDDEADFIESQTFRAYSFGSQMIILGK